MALSLKDLFTLLGTICIVLITFFLCWGLFEIARLMRQANQLVGDTRHKFEEIGEKLSAVTKYFSFLVVAAKQMMSYFNKRKTKKTKKTIDEPLE